MGGSGTGKSHAVEYIERKHGIPFIRSYTDRPQREEKDIGHTFLTPEEFDKLNKHEMIAFNDSFGARYCALASQVKDKTCYIIDENGLRFIRDNCEDMFDIYTLRIYRSGNLIKIDNERKDRDKNQFKMSIYDFDYAILNNTTFEEFESKLDLVVDKIFNSSYEEVFGII